MTTKVVPGSLVAAEGPREAAVEAGERLGKVLRQILGRRGSAAIALSGGETPRGAYGELARQKDIDWSKVSVFFVDERAGAPMSERSNYRMVKESLIDPAGIPAENVIRMESDGPDLEAAAKRYQASMSGRVTEQGGVPSFDLIVFGIGSDGHTASLFPGHAALKISNQWVAHVAATAGREARLTLTLPVLERAQHSVVLAVGAEKHPALERIWDVNGSIEVTPARLLRGVRGRIVWIIDRSAAGLA